VVRRALLALVACGAAPFAVVQGCGPADLVFPCDDPRDPTYDDPACVEARALEDAGADGADASSNGDASGASACACVPNPPNYFHAPQPFWIGDNTSEAPLFCPPEIGAFGGRMFAGLEVPTPGCQGCKCKDEIKGTCSPPNSILVRAATCDVAQAFTVDFGAPASWDGSCTNVNVLPAGAECPPGAR